MYLKKSLGQHLLVDEGALDGIVEAAGVGPGTRVFEIGPGAGALTKRLLNAGAAVTAVELDDRFAARLSDYATREDAISLNLVHADILSVDFDEALKPALAHGKLKVVANLPYNIATAVIIRLLERPDLFSDITALVQKEVADRIAAPPKDSARGSLSVFCQSRAECVPGMLIPPSSFDPPPKVMSRLVKLKPFTADPFGIINRKLFDRLVESAFEHRRKTCYNSMRISLEKGAGASLLPPEMDAADLLDKLFESAGIGRPPRAQELDMRHWASLANAADNILKC